MLLLHARSPRQSVQGENLSAQYLLNFLYIWTVWCLLNNVIEAIFRTRGDHHWLPSKQNRTRCFLWNRIDSSSNNFLKNFCVSFWFDFLKIYLIIAWKVTNPGIFLGASTYLRTRSKHSVISNYFTNCVSFCSPPCSKPNNIGFNWSNQSGETSVQFVMSFHLVCFYFLPNSYLDLTGTVAFPYSFQQCEEDLLKFNL